MIHLAIILCVLTVHLRDPGVAVFGPPAFAPLQAALLSLGGFALLNFLTDRSVRRLGLVVDRSGSWHAVYRAEHLVRRARLMAAGIHLFNVLVLGWVEAVRSVTTDLILADELVAVAPLVLSWCGGWWSLAPIERRVREASLIRDLDTGVPLRTIVSSGQFVISNLRYHVLIALVPILLLVAWAEIVERYGPRWFGVVPGSAAGVLVQLAGVAALFALMPLGLRLVWDTVPMGPGPLRDAITALCRRSRVRIGNLLVWRTHGLMLNGAVIGLFWPLRYILLTDALLESLAPDQIEAVAAHEVGHVRRRHLLWLAAAMLTAVVGIGMVLSVVQVSLAIAIPGLAASPVVEGFMALVTLAMALMILGYVSRTFERQADAFAVRAVSRRTSDTGEQVPSPVVTAEAVSSLHTALSVVANASGLPIRRFTWRHGSIMDRQRRLEALIGRPVNRLSIDREVRWLKVTIALGMLSVIVVAAGGYALASVVLPSPSAPLAPRSFP